MKINHSKRISVLSNFDTNSENTYVKAQIWLIFLENDESSKYFKQR